MFLRYHAGMNGRERKYDCLVVGGGAAGMMAAGRAAERGAQVLLLEKNGRLGEKLRITGGGRCNVTNAITDRHVLTARYGDKGKHLHNLFARFTPEDMRGFLRRFDLDTKVEQEQRVFPVTDSAESVQRVLARYLRDGGVTVRSGTVVQGLLQAVDPESRQNRIIGVETQRGEQIRARAVIIATGGTSHPETGSTGDGYPWLQSLGLPVGGADVSLVPIRVPDPWIRDLQGLSLQDAGLYVERLEGQNAAGPTDPHVRDHASWANAKRSLNRRGKLLFTHFGLSGPLALNTASTIRELASGATVRIRIDLVPDVSEDAYRHEVQTTAGSEGGTLLSSFLRRRFPPRLTRAICECADLDAGLKLAGISKRERRLLVETVKGMPCSFGGLMGQDKAVVTSGGLDPAAVDFRTMQVRGIPNLYVVGDLLDFNRQSGGYSLQICWASGWVAGTHAASLAPKAGP